MALVARAVAVAGAGDGVLDAEATEDALNAGDAGDA